MCRARSLGMVFRSAVLWVVLFGLSSALILAASPDLHRLVHQDARDDGHQCLVTILDGGGMEPSCVPPAAVAPLPAVAELLPVQIVRQESPFLDRATYRRGPPA
jgi:hypothetical protein